MILAWIPHGEMNLSSMALLGSASASTASVASFFLSVLMIGVVLGSQRFAINPDNIATPIAAALGYFHIYVKYLPLFGKYSLKFQNLGDLTTLSVLAIFGRLFLDAEKSGYGWFNLLAILSFLFVIPVFALMAWRDSSSREVLRNGWTPIIFAMYLFFSLLIIGQNFSLGFRLISSSGGLVLEHSIRSFKQLAVYQPVINGMN